MVTKKWSINGQINPRGLIKYMKYATRVITIPKELDEKLNNYLRENGLKRSHFISFLISEFLSKVGYNARTN